MSKSTGQWIGTAVGAVAGFFLPGSYVALGASLGGMVGGMIDPPKGPNITGPRLDDLSYTSSSYGTPRPRGYGTFPVAGNIVWLEGDQYREVTMTESQGGKGGGGQETTTYAYYATFAVSLLQVTDPTQTVSLRRLWIGTKLVYDAGSDDILSIIASHTDGVNFTFYNGTNDQAPNPRWQADKGVNAVSGYPGRCYLVIEDLDMTPYGNTLAMAQIKAELTVGPVTPEYHLIAPLLSGEAGTTTYYSACRFTSSHLSYSRLENDSWGGGLLAAKFTSVETGVDTVSESSIDLNIGLPITYYLVPYLTQSDRDAVLILSGIGYPSNTGVQIWLVDGSSGVISSGPVISNTLVGYLNHVAVLAGSELFLGVFDGTATKIVKLLGLGYQCSSAGNHRVMSMGASENYLFAVQEPSAGDTSTTTTVWKFARSDLTLVATYTETVPTPATISVVDDDTFYTGHSDNHIRKWVDGAIVSDLGTLMPHGFGLAVPVRRWFSVISDNPPLAYSVVGAQVNVANHYVGHGAVNENSAALHDVVTAECGLASIAASDLDLTSLINHSVRGFRIAERGSVRAALEPLQARYTFDVAHSGYKLRFVSRGGDSAITIPTEDLGAVAEGEKDPVLLPVAREMEAQLPWRVTVRYLDPKREYDLGEQYAERPAAVCVNERSLDMPLVMTATEAAKTADVLLAKEWVERTEFGPFEIPPTYRAVEAADIVTVEHRGQAHDLRVTRAEYLPDGRMSCHGRLTAPQSYTSTAIGEEANVAGVSLVALRGTTTAYLLDIPRIRSEQDVAGMSFGLLGMAVDWPGGVLLRSDDSGNTWASIGAMNVKARVFTVATAAPAYHSYSVDHGTVLTVTPVTPGAELFSVTEEQLYSQSNLAVYGADGRWEVIAFQTATDNGDGTYALRDLLRGLYGSERTVSLHAAGDKLVMLDIDRLGFSGLPLAAINSPRLYRGVTSGALLDSAPNMTKTYGAINLKPLSVVDVTMARSPMSFDWTVGWSRRSRWPTPLFSGVAVPLGETSESYEVEFWSAGYGALLRTVTGLSSPSCVYTSAQQASDSGSNQITIQGKIYQLSSVVGRGDQTLFSRTLLVGADPYISGLTLGLHMEGANNSTTFTDVKGNTVTAVGDAKLTTAGTQFAFGASCGVFDGAGDRLEFTGTSVVNFGASKFTIDGHVRPATVGTLQVFVDARGTTNDYACSFIVDMNAAGKLRFSASASNAGVNGTWQVQLIGTTTLVAGAEYHVEASRDDGNVWRLFLNGTQEATATSSLTVGTPATTVFMGAGCNGAGSVGYYLNGRLKDWRVTKGFCRHSSNFTPPAAPFPDP